MPPHAQHGETRELGWDSGSITVQYIAPFRLPRSTSSAPTVCNVVQEHIPLEILPDMVRHISRNDLGPQMPSFVFFTLRSNIMCRCGQCEKDLRQNPQTESCGGVIHMPPFIRSTSAITRQHGTLCKLVQSSPLVTGYHWCILTQHQAMEVRATQA